MKKINYIIKNDFNNEDTSNQKFTKRSEAVKHGEQYVREWFKAEGANAVKLMVKEYRAHRGCLSGIISVVPENF